MGDPVAKARRVTLPGFLRERIRGGVRDKASRDEIHADIATRYPEMNKSVVGRIISQEQRREVFVNNLAKRDKRKNIDLRRFAACGPGTTTARISITIRWFDERTQKIQEWGEVTETPTKGRLADLLNSAIEGARKRAIDNNYKPPEITSANTSGDPSYRINYVECL